MYLESDALYMDLALAEAEKAESAGEVPVGAVIVFNETVIGRGFNQPITAHDATAHAEIIALRKAGQTVGNYPLSRVTKYYTVEPCKMFGGPMIHARIVLLVLGTP